MQTKDLRAILKDLKGLFAAADAKEPVKDFDAIDRLLEPCDDEDVSETLDRIARDLTADPEPVDITIARHAQKLRDAGYDATAFGAAFAALKSDKAMTKPAVFKVLKMYAGPHVRATTKKAALDQIERHFTSLIYDRHADEQAKRATPW